MWLIVYWVSSFYSLFPSIFKKIYYADNLYVVKTEFL